MNVNDVGVKLTFAPKYNDGTNPYVNYVDFSGTGTRATLTAVSPTGRTRKTFPLTIVAPGNRAYYITQPGDFTWPGQWTFQVRVYNATANPIGSWEVPFIVGQTL